MSRFFGRSVIFVGNFTKFREIDYDLGENVCGCPDVFVEGVGVDLLGFKLRACGNFDFYVKRG